MVDGIRLAGSVRTTPASPVLATNGAGVGAPGLEPRPQRAEPRATASDDTSSIGNLAKAIAASAPVDKERVAQIKRAIATGNFPLLPATIADRLLALKLEWTGRDPQS